MSNVGMEPLPVPPPHLAGGRVNGDGATWMPDVWEYIVKSYGICSVLDVGCADGWNTAWFAKYGLEVLGVEGFAALVQRSVLPPACIVQHDYSLGPYVPPKTFDLCWSSEFVEHVEEQYMQNFFASFAKCKYLCMTHAVPKQGGDHHVNCQDTVYWIQALEKIGFVYDALETAYLRSTDTKEFSYGRATLTWFSNSRIA